MTDRSWAFLSTHGVMLVEIARAPDATVRELAERARITERQAHRVLADLCEGGYVLRRRSGRRNLYSVNAEAEMRLPNFAEHRIDELLSVLVPARDD